MIQQASSHARAVLFMYPLTNVFERCSWSCHRYWEFPINCIYVSYVIQACYCSPAAIYSNPHLSSLTSCHLYVNSLLLSPASCHRMLPCTNCYLYATSHQLPPILHSSQLYATPTNCHLYLPPTIYHLNATPHLPSLTSCHLCVNSIQ